MDRIDTLIRELEGTSATVERGAILDALTYAHASKWIDTATFHSAQKMLHVGAFLSAALTLVPEGLAWTMYSDGSIELGPEPSDGQMMDSVWAAEAATPALALCIVALKARRGA